MYLVRHMRGMASELDLRESRTGFSRSNTMTRSIEIQISRFNCFNTNSFFSLTRLLLQAK